jgi:Domain of unknown function (DUF4116)
MARPGKKRPPSDRRDEIARKKSRASRNPRSFLAECSEEDRQVKELVLEVVKTYGQGLKDASEELRGDLDVVSAAVRNDSKALEYCTRLEDRDFLMTLIPEVEGTKLDLTSILKNEKLQDDVKLVELAVMHNGLALEGASERLRKNPQIVETAVKKDGLALEFACDTLRQDRDIVLKAVSNHGGAIFFASEDLRDDKEVVLTAIKNMKGGSMSFTWVNTGNIQYASERLQKDRDVLLAIAAIESDILSHSSIPEEMRQQMKSDRDFALQMIRHHDGKYKHYADILGNFEESIRSDREVVLEAVKVHGTALQYASIELRNDREVVLAAVNTRYPWVMDRGDPLHSYRYASEALRNDPEIAMAAVKNNGCVLEYLPDSFRNDPKYVEAGMPSLHKIMGGDNRIFACAPQDMNFVTGEPLKARMRLAGRYLIRQKVIENYFEPFPEDYDEREEYWWTWEENDPETRERFRVYAEQNLRDLLERQRLLETFIANNILQLPEHVVGIVKSFSLDDEIREAENLNELMPVLLGISWAFHLPLPRILKHLSSGA